MADELWNARFKRGARPSPAHKLLGAVPFVPMAAPAQFAVVPTKLSMWDNERDGDCVTAEEAFAKAWWSTFAGVPELFIPDAEVIRWARKYGFLNGATLTDVMDVMRRDGFTVGGINYTDGPYKGVDYGNEAILQSALTTGPVKIAIDADALPPGAGNHQGWSDTSGARFRNTDHCVSISGYGRADYLYDALKVAVPANLAPSTPGYLIFTWSTLGFVTHEWLMGTCVEAWVRNPTCPQIVPGPTPPPPPPPPNPEPFMDYNVIVSGKIPVGLGGRLVDVTLTGHATPAQPGLGGFGFKSGDMDVLGGLGDPSRSVPAAAGPGGIPWIKLILDYGLPIALKLLPYLMSPDFAALPWPQKIAWLAAAANAIREGKDVPPLPKPAEPKQAA